MTIWAKCAACNGTGTVLDYPADIGLRLRSQRLAADIGLQAIAREIGWSAAYISLLENGRRRLSPALVDVYTAALQRLKEGGSHT